MIQLTAAGASARVCVCVCVCVWAWGAGCQHGVAALGWLDAVTSL